MTASTSTIRQRLLLSTLAFGNLLIQPLLTSPAGHLYAQTTTATPVLPEGVTKGSSIEGISEYNLKNGLKVLLFPDVSKPTITVNITYLVGSRHEGLAKRAWLTCWSTWCLKAPPNTPTFRRN